MLFGICLCSPPSEVVLFWLPSWGSIYEALCCSQLEGNTISKVSDWRNFIYISCISVISHVSCIPHSCLLFSGQNKGGAPKGKKNCESVHVPILHTYRGKCGFGTKAPFVISLMPYFLPSIDIAEPVLAQPTISIINKVVLLEVALQKSTFRWSISLMYDLSNVQAKHLN